MCSESGIIDWLYRIVFVCARTGSVYARFFDHAHKLPIFRLPLPSLFIATYCGSYAFLFPLLVALLTCLIYLPQAEGLYCLKSVSVDFMVLKKMCAP